MIKTIELVLLPEEAADKAIRQLKASEALGIPESDITFLNPLKRSIDARSKHVKIRMRAEVFINEPPPAHKDFSELFDFRKNVSGKTPVVIAGAGPAGLFAALRLIELGIKPVIIERGKK